jgi:hypothetical protein
VGALANLGHSLSDQTVGDLLRRRGIPPAPKRSQTTTWKEFIRRHRTSCAEPTSSSVEVLTWRGLVTYYVFFLPLESRRFTIAGIAAQPDQNGMQQIARNATLDPWGYLNHCRYVLHDRDPKFSALFQNTLATAKVKCLTLPRRSPDWNALAERWVRSVNQECLDQLLFGGGVFLKTRA